MSVNESKIVCVSIHDVAPATWPACLRLLEAVRQVAQIPTTLLVVPRYHGAATRDAGYEAMLSGLLEQGHELALHGYTHLDRAPPAHGLPGRYRREVFTTGEGEFAAVDALRARRLMALGLAWFAARGWPVSGFVAPAWLLGAGAWQALHGQRFTYTTTLTHFHLLASRRALLSPSLVYTARNRAGRLLSPPAVTALAACLAPARLVRLSLHPPDADHPQLLLHAQRVLGALLEHRQPLTKAAFARAADGAPAATFTGRS